MSEEIIEAEVVPVEETSDITAVTHQRDTLVSDLEAALQLVHQYQRIVSMAELPDPNFVAARRLLSKWGMSYNEPPKAFRVYAEGQDITEHPDSIEGEAHELLLEDNGESSNGRTGDFESPSLGSNPSSPANASPG